ncbi:hypothetical protein PIPA1_10680 [Pelosinus sp. IPA-1]|nr:hypothetical protein PIPA1_10680 [Pelosinus sp. IPA-1]
MESNIQAVEKLPYWRKLLGFRTKTWWKMILATLTYVSMLALALIVFKVTIVAPLIYIIIRVIKSSIHTH